MNARHTKSSDITAKLAAAAQSDPRGTAAVAIPCHRAVRSDGAVSGYRWGVERKRTLLEREAQM
jgi:AraC family transcriptional regulator, regulatory protein of adaptative response / methylated-DNA-[protein]-cysteine methyltransferase